MAKSGKNYLKQLTGQLIKPSDEEGLKFPNLPDSSPDPILISDNRGRIFYVNSSWENFTGYSFKEVAGQRPSFLQDRNISKKIYNQLRDALLEGKSFSTDEIRDRKKNGKLYQVRSTFFPVKKNNKKRFYVQVMHDITEHRKYERKLHEREQMLQLIMNNTSGYAMYLLNKNGIIKTWNSGSEKLKGYTAEEVLGKYFAIFFSEEDRKKKKPQKILAIAAKKGRYEGEAIHVRKDGTYFWADVVVNAIRSKRGTLKGFVKITREITAQKELEQQKDAFIGIASHELKTPITALRAYTEILEKRFKKKGDQKDRYFISNIIEQADRVTALIDDLLNVSRIDAGKIELQLKEIDLVSLIKKIIRDFQYTTESHNISLESECSLIVVADENRVEQVLINLLSNAIKYSPQGKKVIIHLKKNGEYAIIGVQDFGLGIAKEDLPHLFTRFYRTKEKEESKVKGFGLGLYISYEIIKKLRGKMWVESEKGKGSTFYFSLPVVPQE